MKESEREFLLRVQRELRTGKIDYDRLGKELSGNPDYHRHADSLYRAAQQDPERMAEIWSQKLDEELEKARKAMDEELWTQAYRSAFPERQKPIEKPKPVEPPKSFAERMAEKAKENSGHAEMVARAEADGMVEEIVRQIEQLAGEGEVTKTFWVGNNTPSVALAIRKLKSEYSVHAQLYCEEKGKKHTFGIYVKWGNAYHETW